MKKTCYSYGKTTLRRGQIPYIASVTLCGGSRYAHVSSPFLALAFSRWAKHTGAGSAIQHTETTAVPPGQHWFPIQNSVDSIERAQDSVSWAPACATL